MNALSEKSPATSGWVFEVIPPMGGATGNAFSNTLQGTGDPSARLVREAIQNSTDAATDTKVTVHFRYRTLKEAEKAAFLQAAEIGRGFAGRESKLGFDVANVLATGSQAKPLGLLYIEDYRTTGLRGELVDDTSDFHRLLLTIGDDQKAIDNRTSSGGSYGYGKAVLSSNSHIRTIFAYSLARDGEAGSAKLLGCSYCSKHDHADRRYTGRAWLGSSVQHDVVAPFVGDAAHDFAERLGFRPRRRDEFGTSILIVDCAIKLDDLRRDTETYWWPRLIDDELEVEFSENGVVQDPPRPKQRADLRPFITSYDMVVGRALPLGKHQTVARMNRVQGNELGRYAFEVLAPSAEETDEASLSDDLRNRIAVLRKPKMIVAYLAGYTRQAPDIVGVFMADEAVDNYLKMSEPPDHTAWEPNSGRLAKMKDQETAVECIRAIHSRLRTKAKEFQATAMPPPVKSGARLTRLEQMLGAFFRTLGEGSGESKEDPVAIEFSRVPSTKDVDRKRKTADGQFEIMLKNKHAAESVEATIELEVSILEDGAAGEGLSFELTDEHAGARQSFPEGRAKIIKLLKKAESYRFSFFTAPYDKQWSLSPNVRVTIEEGANV